jgi:hypothetical protein
MCQNSVLSKGLAFCRVSIQSAAARRALPISELERIHLSLERWVIQTAA